MFYIKKTANRKRIGREQTMHQRERVLCKENVSHANACARAGRGGYIFAGQMVTWESTQLARSIKK